MSPSSRRNVVLDVLVLGFVLLAVQLLEDGLVPLVHEEALALGQHLVDDLVEEVRSHSRFKTF